MSSLREAARAVGRGAEAEALVLLWNELEPARLAGDRGALQTIASLARRIATEGDEAHRREAERLLEAVERYAAGEAIAPGAVTAEVDGELSPVGEEVRETIGDEATTAPTGRSGLGGLLWLVLLAAIVLFNLLGELFDR